MMVPVCDPSTGVQRQGVPRTRCPASLAKVIHRPMRDAVSKNKVNGSYGARPDAVLWPVCVHTRTHHIHTQTWTCAYIHMHLKTYAHAKNYT